MNICEELAKRVADTRFEGLPQGTIHWAKLSILDTVAVAFAGSREPGVQIAKEVLAENCCEGPSLVFGTDRRVPPLEAAMINGMSAHVLDFDTSNDTFEGHPSVHLLPALFALAEQKGASGRDLLVSYIAGFETQARLAQATQPGLVGKGWFPTSSLGVFGAAAGAGHLLGLDTAQIAQAISLSAMFASGTLAHAGSMTKPLGSGHAARNGLLAALLVEKKFTAAPDAITDPRGFLTLFGSLEKYDLQAVLDSWGNPYDVDETAIGIKRYPCCGIIHSSLDLVSDFLESDQLTADEIEKIDIYLITQRLHHINRPDPRSAIEGKFSVQYCVAKMIVEKQLGVGSFEIEAINDPKVRALMGRITAQVHPDVRPSARRQEGGSEIVVTTRDGRRLSRNRQKALGRVPGIPLPDSIVDAKFMDCTSMVIPPPQGAKLLSLLKNIEDVPSVRDISEAMTPR